MRSGYSNSPRPYRPTGGNGFVYTGTGRECQECYGVSGHERWCDKTK